MIYFQHVGCDYVINSNDHVLFQHVGCDYVINSKNMVFFQHVGCDYVINSNAKEDHCGVCRGDGTTCETIKDQYNETQGLGKNFIHFTKIA